jgi:hypothetical protein
MAACSTSGEDAPVVLTVNPEVSGRLPELGVTLEGWGRSVFWGTGKEAKAL